MLASLVAARNRWTWILTRWWLVLADLAIALVMSTPAENCAGIAGRKLRGQRDFLGTTSLVRSLSR